MSGFDPAWLRLRAGADDEAREPILLTQAASYAAEADSPLIVDLGCGLGATRRVMHPLLPATTRWRLVDSDARLLTLAAPCGDERIEACRHDLAAPGRLPIADARLVTASALLDLTSAAWIDRLMHELAEAGIALYAALSYDGTTSWSPVHDLDAVVLAAFNRHQRGDKGFGSALGPEALCYLARALQARGYRVRTTPSPWRLTGKHELLMRSLIEGIASAAKEEGSLSPSRIDEWRDFRLDKAAEATGTIGHQDLFAVPSAKAQSTMKSPPRS